jgi:hypothetical protein
MMIRGGGGVNGDFCEILIMSSVREFLSEQNSGEDHSIM